ncbi:4'-phosphopantetheinyl transferase family protein, partial [Streptomyces lonarensis]|uniref:4'-phosphopantetheinyl transferase family protein n=1 Tax=Streptomyces lonarensis TaxID=700599 RepID=UPI0030C77E46
MTGGPAGGAPAATAGRPFPDGGAPPPGGVVPLGVPGGAAARHGARVWLGRVAPAGAEDRAALDAAESARAERMAPGPVRERYVAARAAIRRLLAAELGCTPQAVEWGRHPCPRCPDPAHGRPRLTAPAGAPEVGVSRTGPWWLLAVADAPVGADVEHLSPAGRGALVRRCFSAAERRWLAELPEPERAAALARGWVRKEAVTKAWG